MEEVSETKSSRIYDIFMKYMPLFILGFVILMTGLSFIGDFFVIGHTEGEEYITKNVGLATLLFSNTAGVGAQIYFIFIYLVLPIIACVLLIFSPPAFFLIYACFFPRRCCSGPASTRA